MERSSGTSKKNIPMSTIEQLLEPGKGNLSTKDSGLDSTFCASISKTKKASETKEKPKSAKAVKIASRDSCLELPKEKFTRKIVECCYKAAGCKAKLKEGSLEEKAHHQNCHFRPIPCLMQYCSQVVPYPNFLLHLMKHFVTPSFSRHLNTTVYFEKEDFEQNNRWQPRWINCYHKDFFIMLSHRLSGMWYFWVCMMGTPEEAENFLYDIKVYRNEDRRVGTYSVLSLRTSIDEIEKSEISLSMTDHQIRRISQIKDNIVGSFDLDLVIYKEKPAGTSRICLQ